MKEIIGEIEVKDREKIVITLEKYYEKLRVDFRLHYLSDPYRNDRWKETIKGFSIPVEKLKDFKDIIENGEDLLKKIQEKERLSRLEQLDMFGTES